MTYKFGVVLDERRLAAVRGTPLERLLKPLFGGSIMLLEIEVPDEVAKKILAEFPDARVDARGFIEDVPVAFRKAVFEVLAAKKSQDIWSDVLAKLPEIKREAEKEKEYLPPPI
ncbi:MAG: hypothetical protein JZD41_02335 [Thermoproteus sp.]|nr:hypothetical protein [Thermoproteus sp.]